MNTGEFEGNSTDGEEGTCDEYGALPSIHHQRYQSLQHAEGRHEARGVFVGLW